MACKSLVIVNCIAAFILVCLPAEVSFLSRSALVSMNFFTLSACDCFLEPLLASIGSGFLLKAAIVVWLASFLIDLLFGVTTGDAILVVFTPDALYGLFLTGVDINASMSLLIYY